MFTGFGIIVSFLLRFRVIQGSTREPGVIWYSSYDLLDSTSVVSFYSQVFNLGVVALLIGLADVPPQLGFDFGRIIPAN